MQTKTGIIAICGIMFAATTATAQGPRGGREAGLTKSADVDDLVTRMMAFDKDGDGKLAKAEVTDARLNRVFVQADANKDGSVTKEELADFAAKEHSDRPGFGGPPGGGPGGGPGGPRMGPTRPGEVLPPMIRQRLGLTPEQISQLDDLQKEVDAKLVTILSDEQQTQLKEMRDRGPGGRRPGAGGPPPDRPR